MHAVQTVLIHGAFCLSVTVAVCQNIDNEKIARAVSASALPSFGETSPPALARRSLGEDGTLPNEKINTILAKYDNIISRVQSDAFIKEAIANGEKVAHKYTTPEFIEKVVYPERYHEKQQLIFNKKLLYSVQAPQGIEQFTNTPHIGIYAYDAMLATHLGSSWGLEYLFCKMINKQLLNYYAQEISKKVSTSTLNQPFETKLTPTFSRKIVGSLVGYALISVILQKTGHYYLIDRDIDISGMDGNPLPISKLLPLDARNYFAHYGTPNSWTGIIKGLLQKIDALPEWSLRLEAEIIKETLALLFWLRWYERNIIVPYCNKFLEDYGPELLNKNDSQDLNKAITIILNQNFSLSFLSWLAEKTFQICLWQGIINLILATPALYSKAKWLYDAYESLQKPQKQKANI